MDPQANNLELDLHEAFASKYVKLGQYNISVSNRQPYMNFGPAGSQPVAYGAPDVDLYLKFYIDQAATLTKEDIFTQLEDLIGDFCHHVQGAFIERTVEPFRQQHAMTVSYRLKIYDYDVFQEKLHNFALAKLDKEFAKVLEEKLSED